MGWKKRAEGKRVRRYISKKFDELFSIKGLLHQNDVDKVATRMKSQLGDIPHKMEIDYENKSVDVFIKKNQAAINCIPVKIIITETGVIVNQGE